jgi:hypothetical protein
MTLIEAARDLPERVVRPTGRGFLRLDSHPVGCIRTVRAIRPRRPDTAVGSHWRAATPATLASWRTVDWFRAQFRGMPPLVAGVRLELGNCQREDRLTEVGKPFMADRGIVTVAAELHRIYSAVEP